MNRNTLRSMSSLKTWAPRQVLGAAFAVIGLLGAAAPALADDVNVTRPVITQSPIPVAYGDFVTFSVMITTQGNVSASNVGLNISATPDTPSGAGPTTPTTCSVAINGSPAPVGPSCTQFTGLSLSANDRFVVSVVYPTPTAGAFSVVATSQAAKSGTSAQVFKKATYSTSFAAQPSESPPTVSVALAPQQPSLVASNSGCPLTVPETINDPCGPSYASYLLTVAVTQDGTVPGRQFSVVVSGDSPGTSKFIESSCAGKCGPSTLNTPIDQSAKFNITGLRASDGPIAFRVVYKTPELGSPTTPTPPTFTVSAVASVFNSSNNPGSTLGTSASASATGNLATLPPPNYSAFLPSLPASGSLKARNTVNPNGTGPYSGRVAAEYAAGDYPDGVTGSIGLNNDNQSCSPAYGGNCLVGNLTILAGSTGTGPRATFGPPNPLSGPGHLVITLIRDWTTFPAQTSAALNAPIYYTDTDTGIKTVVNRCQDISSTDPTIKRCVYQRINNMTFNAGHVTGGTFTFVIWASENGIYSW